jgi:hypothetical protein
VLAKDTALAQSCGDRSHFACLFSEAHADVYSFRRSSIAIMNNRLGDISGWAHDDESTNGDIELGTQQQNASSQPKHMEHFFREVDAIKKDIDAVKKATKAIGDINEAALQATTTEEENTLSQRLRPVVDQTNKRAKRTKNMLGLLKEENQKLKGDGDVKPSDLRYGTRYNGSRCTLFQTYFLIFAFLFFLSLVPQYPRESVQHVDSKVH